MWTYTTTITDRPRLALSRLGEHLRTLVRILGAALFLSACTSTSIASDLRRVDELSRGLSTPGTRGNLADIRPLREVEELLRRPLDENTALRIALLNHRPLRARLLSLGIARGQLIQAGLMANPRVEVELLPERDSAVELRAEYSLTSLLLRPLRRKVASEALARERLSAAAAIVALGYEVRRAFYALQAAELRQAKAKENVAAFAASREAAQSLFDAGNLPQITLSAQVAAHERAKAELALFELAVVASREEMQRLMGLHGEHTGWQSHGALASAPPALETVEHAERRALQVNLELRALRRQLNVLARSTGLVRASGSLPDIEIDVHSLYARREGSESLAAGRDWRWGAGLSLSVPLFDRKQGTRRAYEAEFDATFVRYEGLAIDLRSRIRESLARLRSTHARALHYQDVIVPSQRKVREETLLQYNAMQASVFQLVQARREEFAAESAYIDSLRAYWSAKAEVDAWLAGAFLRAVDPAAAAAGDEEKRDEGEQG